MLINRGMDYAGSQPRATQEASAQETDRTIYEELGELAKYVEATTRAIRDMETPVATTADQIPQATDFLTDLARMTEEGTHKIMSLVEAIEDNRRQIQSAVAKTKDLLAKDGQACSETLKRIETLLGQDEGRLMDINVALSFQDLVAQRVKKLVTILEDVQHKLLKLVVVFGLQQRDVQRNHDERGYQMLKQLEQTKTTSLKQDLVDDILGEFGFQ